MFRRSVFAALLLCLAVATCERAEEPDQAIPPGVSVEPPRAAPGTGSLTVPGAPVDTVEEAVGATDTVPAEQ